MGLFTYLFNKKVENIKSKQDYNSFKSLFQLLQKYGRNDKLSHIVSNAIVDMLENLKSKQDFKLLFLLLQIYGRDDKQSHISNAIVDIGTIETLMSTRKTIDEYKLNKSKISYEYFSLLSNINFQLTKKLAPIAPPITLSTSELENSWNNTLKKIPYPKYKGESVNLKELKEEYEQGKVNCEKKCWNCFHNASVQIKGGYEVYVGRQVDYDVFVDSICLYCGEMGAHR